MQGLELRVLTTDSNGPEVNDRLMVEEFPTRLPAGYEVYYCRHRWVMTFAPGMFRRLWSMVKWADVVHLTAVYSPPTIPTLLACKALRKPLVWSTRGALQRWDGTTRRRVKKIWEQVCNLLCEQRRVVLHVTSVSEKEESGSMMTSARAEVIPNGVDVPPTANGSRQWRPENSLRLLALGRLHPIKGIENLLHALARLDDKVVLEICGDGAADYRESLRSLIHDLALNERVFFHGNVSGEEKAARFQEADVCIVPSYKENFCMVIAESLAAGVPVIASRGTPWGEMESIGCGLWVENDEEHLAGAIRQINGMSLREMGQKGRAWMEREYSWRSVAEKMAELYRSLCQHTACVL